MRLLAKHDIDSKKAQERKQEIDEGVKLSRKVDELRRLEVDEKVRITAWRDSTLASIRQEIENDIKTRDSIRAENLRLERENKRLREPLDAEWQEVRNEKYRLLTLDNTLLEKQDVLIERQAQLERAEREHEIERRRLATLKHSATEKLVQTDKTLEKAREEAAKMRNDAHTTLTRAELTDTLAAERELQVAIRERDVDNKEANVAKYEQRVFAKEQQLKDFEQSLLAAQKEKETDGESNTKRSTKKGR